MPSILDKPFFRDEAAAYAKVESIIWPNGPVCVHCGERNRIGLLKGKATRPGVYKCYGCRKQFRATVNTIFESSHIAMHHWLQAVYLIVSSKKGISSNQLHRTMGITLKSAWFMSHRIREAMKEPSRQPTVSVSLPGDRRRLRQAILYVAEKCQGARHFGAIKLNKIIWKADFDSYRVRGVPVTGREYRRQKLGPALREMVPVQDEMLRDGAIRIEPRDYGDGIVEKRTIALDRPDMAVFSPEDLACLDESIRHYWNMTGREASDESHGIAWQTRFNGDPMPYESALLSERHPGQKQWERIAALVRRREISTQ